MSTELATDQLKQEIDSGLLEFFELTIGSDTASRNILYFHDGTKENLDDVVFAGNTYIALPIIMDGIELKADGAMSRPSLTVANVESILKSGSKFKTQNGSLSRVYSCKTENFRKVFNKQPCSRV